MKRLKAKVVAMLVTGSIVCSTIGAVPVYAAGRSHGGAGQKKQTSQRSSTCINNGVCDGTGAGSGTGTGICDGTGTGKGTSAGTQTGKAGNRHASNSKHHGR